MKILITGGTGFLGNALARRLMAEGEEIRVVGRNPMACAALAEAGAEVVQADLRDEQAMVAACSNVDVIYHVGALSSPWGKRADFFDINVGGTKHIIRGCHKFQVKRLIYVSSGSVLFSGGDCINMNESTPFPRRFASVYSQTKKIGEDLVLAASHDFETVILRPKAIFGPGDPSLLPRILDAARRGRLVQIGNGRNLIDLTYIDNVVEALALSLRSEEAIGKAYLIAGGESVPIWRIIEEVLCQLGLPHHLRPVPFRLIYALAGAMEMCAAITGKEPALTRFSVSLLAHTQTCDISAARRDLGYKPIVSVAQGVERTIAALQTAESLKRLGLKLA